MRGLLVAVVALAWTSPALAQTDTAVKKPVSRSDTSKAKPPAKKNPSVLKAMVGAVADTVGSAAAATVIDTLSGGTGRAVGARMGAGTPGGGCPPGYIPATAPSPGGTTGQVLVGAAKRAARAAKAASDSTAPPPPPEEPAQPQCVPAPAGPSSGYPGTEPAPQPGPGFNPAMMTPAGAVITAAPLAVEGGKAVGKAVRGMFGGNPRSKFDILKDLEGKGLYQVRGFRFLPNMDALDEGYEAHMSSLVDALAMAKGPYGIHIQPEAADNEEPDAELAASRRHKLGTLLLAGGVSEAVFTPDAAVPDELRPEPDRIAKPGEAKIYLVKVRARKAKP